MKQVQLAKIELCKLRPFEHHPYKVQDDAEMEALTESIKDLSFRKNQSCQIGNNPKKFRVALCKPADF